MVSEVGRGLLFVEGLACLVGFCCMNGRDSLSLAGANDSEPNG